MNKCKLGLSSMVFFIGMPSIAHAFPTQVPEPSVLPLMVVAGIAMYLIKRKK